VFGSYPLELHLPDSDIDLVVFKDSTFNRKYISDTEHLEMIYEELVKRKFVDHIRLVDAEYLLLKQDAELQEYVLIFRKNINLTNF
jgi:DNA polymerase sigma